MTPPASRPPVVALLALVMAACTASGKDMIALEGATLIDGSGGPPIQDALILVRSRHIEAVAQTPVLPLLTPLPQARTKAPADVNSWIRSPPLSAT